MFCTYLTVYSGNKLPPFYIGYTLVEKIKNGYRGSVSSKIYKSIWKSELRDNPHLFKSIILTEHDTRLEASEKEFYFQKFFSVHNNPMYINKALCGGKLYSARLGVKHTEESKRKMVETKKAKLLMGIKPQPRNPEANNKIALALRGKPKSEEHRKKLSLSKIGTKRSEETIRKCVESNRGFKHTEETKAKMRAPKSDDIKSKMSEASKGKRWWNNGTEARRCKDCPGIGFVPGKKLKTT